MAPLARDAAGASTEPAQVAAPRDGIAEWLPLLGRTLVVVGGAFVLRAVTEAGLLGPALGSALAILYAVLWLVMVDRSAAKGAGASAVWHGIAGTVIAFPLLWETTAQFRFLAPSAAALTLGAITAVGLFIAWRRRLLAVASIVTIGAVVTLLALAVATKLPVLFAGWLLVAGLATLWIGYTRAWLGLAWLVAIPADLLAALLTAIVLFGETERIEALLRPGSVIALQLALVIAYIGSFVARTLVTGAEVRALEIAQGIAAVVVGMGGAVAVARVLPAGWVPLGLVSAALGAGGYAVSFTRLDRTARRTNFIFYSSLALVFVLVAVEALLAAGAGAVLLSIGAVLMAWIGAGAGRATPSLHGAVYAASAGIGSGLVGGALSTLTARSAISPGWIGTAALVALAGAVAYCAFPVAQHGRTWGRLSAIPKLVVLTLALVGLAGVLIALGAGLLPRQAGGAVVPSALAILRTTVVSVAAVALAWLGRHPRLMQATWLVYPLLVVGGIKLLVEDLRVAGPAILVASFALYGSALILAPRLTRKPARAA